MSTSAETILNQQVEGSIPSALTVVFASEVGWVSQDEVCHGHLQAVRLPRSLGSEVRLIEFNEGAWGGYLLAIRQNDSLPENFGTESERVRERLGDDLRQTVLANAAESFDGELSRPAGCLVVVEFEAAVRNLSIEDKPQ